MDGHPRYLAAQVERDLSRKMVFVAGPRQVGKTTLARMLLDSPQGYLNWDVADDRESILRRELPPGELLVLDEIHKYRGWRNYLKGLYDGRRRATRILVTGSARLDAYRFGGDSLQGRYHLLRLHPVVGGGARYPDPRASLGICSRSAAFPEPWFGASRVEARRWTRDYRTLLIREEVAGLERVQDLGSLELLMLRLPDLVGSPLSVNALREDLQVSHKSVAAWLRVFERLYAIFPAAPVRLAPHPRGQEGAEALSSRLVARAERVGPLREPRRLPPAQVGALPAGCAGARCRAALLSRHRRAGRSTSLSWDRDRPILCVECKWNDAPLDRSLRYFKARFPDCDAWQISAVGTKDYLGAGGIRVAPALTLLGTLI